ncbi:MAG TPA: PKD domain-containing protein [Pseudonocardiaceae bacterium]|jgi:hypothetical protein|nr:PKD domain-containing protein [Pseudonocardiaceae bacterium]
MLRRGIALSVGALLSLSVLAPAIANAASTADTLYVNNTSGSNCSASGGGTQAAPFCTIQAAANVVNPGQTVQIVGIYTEAVTISRSGTATAPITFVGSGTNNNQPTWIYPPSSTSAPAIAVTGASNVVISKIGLGGTATSKALVISGSTQITADSDSLSENPSSAGYVEITGDSSSVTLRRNIYGGYGATLGTQPAVQVDAGSKNDTITTNDMQGSGGIQVASATGIAVTSNTLHDACGVGIAVTGSSTGVTVENNVIDNTVDVNASEGICPSSTATGLLVDATSAPGVTADYNLVQPLRPTDADYSWAGTTYASAAALTSATGQGGHDINADPKFWQEVDFLQEGSPAIDSANADAPGELSTDLAGNPRLDDPLTPNTGVGTRNFDDRGAYEAQDQVVSDSLNVNATQAPVGGNVHLTGSITDTWSEPVTCTVDFGDGTIVPNADCSSAGHTYTATGTYPITVTPTTIGNLQASLLTSQVTIVPPGGPLNPTLEMTPSGALGLTLSVDSGGDPWNLTGETVDFGTGPIQLTGYVPNFYYGFSTPGPHAVKATITDANGATATVKALFTPVGTDYTPYGPIQLTSTKVPAGAFARVRVGGNSGVPLGITAAALNLTVHNAAAAGQLVVYPDFSRRPATANLTFAPGSAVSGLAITTVAQNGFVDVYNGSAGVIDLTADLAGFFQTSLANGHTTLIQARLRDGTISGGNTAAVPIAGADQGALPSTGIAAVVVNVTAINPSANGFITAYADGSAQPTDESLDYSAGRTTSNTMIVPVGADGGIVLYTSQTTELAVDVAGYFSPNSQETYVPVAPVREGTTQLAPTTTTDAPIADGIANPSEWTTTLVLTTTVTGTTGAGSLSIYRPDGSGAIPSATESWAAGQTVSNVSMPQIPNGLNGVGWEGFYNSGSTPANLTVDLTGYFADTYSIQ